MPFPGDVALTTVEENYFAQSGTDVPFKCVGTVTFVAGPAVTPVYINLFNQGIFVPAQIVGVPDPSTGLMAVDLIPNDLTDVAAPTGFSYHVIEDVKVTIGSTMFIFDRTYDIDVVTSDDPLRLSVLAPVVPSTGGVALVKSVNDIDPNGAGNVTLTAADIPDAYVLPGGGIPAADMAAAVQSALTAAASAYQKPGGGIPSSDLAAAVVTLLTDAGTAYQKPGGGIPETDLATALRTLIDDAEQTGNKGATNGYAGLGADQRVAPGHLALVPQIQTLTIASGLVATDASLGSLFRLSVTGNFTLSNPTNPADGETIEYELTQSGSGGDITLASKFNLGSNTVTLSSGSGVLDKLLVQYRSAADVWDVLSFQAGF